MSNNDKFYLSDLLVFEYKFDIFVGERNQPGAD